MLAFIGAVVHQHDQGMRQFLTRNPKASCRGKHRGIGAGNVALEAVCLLIIFVIRVLQGYSVRFRLAVFVLILRAVPGTPFIPLAARILLLIDRAKLLKLFPAEVAGT